MTKDIHDWPESPAQEMGAEQFAVHLVERLQHTRPEDWETVVASEVRHVADALELIIPSTYFASRPLGFRLRRLVQDWQLAIQVNQELEHQLDALRQQLAYWENRAKIVLSYLRLVRLSPNKNASG